MWEENISRSEELEAEANAIADSETDRKKDLCGQAANNVLKVLSSIPDDAIRGNQAVRAVRLLQNAGQQKRSREVAQSWLGRNSLPQTSLNDLRNLIIVSTNNITVREARRRRLSTNELTTDQNSTPGQAVDPTSQGLFTTVEANILALVSPTSQGLFATVEANILALPVPSFQQICVRALQASVRLDIEHDPPQPSSPKEIATDVGVTIRVQRQLGICLTKDDAFDFLERLGVRPKKSSFNRQLTKGSYERFFRRDISSDGGKPYVFTYAEILHLEGIEPLLTLPPVLEDLLSY
jgi:hypothetical protein